MPNEFYDTLQVPVDAPAADIKKAYYRMVRQHPPEKDPEGFKRIRTAYDTLSDPQARSKYDASQKHGGEIEKLQIECKDLIEKEDWPGVVRRLKKIVVLNPEDDSSRNQLGIFQARAGQLDHAASTFEGLVKRSPDVPLYWSNFGQTLLDRATDLKEGDPQRRRLLGEAREKFRQAAKLERFNPEHYVGVAKTYSAEEKYDQAIEWCEKGIIAPGEGKTDFEALLELCKFYLFAGRLADIPRTASRIEDALPDDEDARKFAAYRLVQIALQLHQLHAFKAAWAFYKAARRFDPGDQEIRDLADRARTVALAIEEYDKFKDDHRIVSGLRRMASLDLASAHDEDIGDRQQIINNIAQEIGSHPSADVISSIDRIRDRYPNIYALDPDYYTRLRRVVNEGQGKSSSAKSDCFVVTATFGSPAAAEVDRFRRYRDRHLRSHAFGRWLIGVYYRVGPWLAERVRRRPWLRQACAVFLGRLATWLPE